MSERSIFVLAVVLVAFSDLLPSARQVEDMTHDVARAPAYTAHEVRSDLTSSPGISARFASRFHVRRRVRCLSGARSIRAP